MTDLEIHKALLGGSWRKPDPLKLKMQAEAKPKPPTVQEAMVVMMACMAPVPLFSMNISQTAAFLADNRNSASRIVPRPPR